MKLGNIRYYTLNRGFLIAESFCDSDLPCPAKSDSHDLAVWDCTNWGTERHYVAGQKVVQTAARRGLSVAEMFAADISWC